MFSKRTVRTCTLALCSNDVTKLLSEKGCNFIIRYFDMAMTSVIKEDSIAISHNGMSWYYLLSGKGDVGVGRSCRRQKGRERTVSYGQEVPLTVQSFLRPIMLFCKIDLQAQTRQNREQIYYFPNQTEAPLNPKRPVTFDNLLRKRRSRQNGEYISLKVTTLS